MFWLGDNDWLCLLGFIIPKIMEDKNQVKYETNYKTFPFMSRNIFQNYV